jgi:hypothetical protein
MYDFYTGYCMHTILALTGIRAPASGCAGASTQPLIEPLATRTGWRGTRRSRALGRRRYGRGGSVMIRMQGGRSSTCAGVGSSLHHHPLSIGLTQVEPVSVIPYFTVVQYIFQSAHWILLNRGQERLGVNPLPTSTDAPALAVHRIWPRETLKKL